MIEYRRFQNSSPPDILRIWESAGLGRGAADRFACDSLELLSFGQPYFDRDGLIMAYLDNVPIGFIHCGFGVSEQHDSLDRTRGVICLLIVNPALRRQGVGSELFRRGVAYLRQNGATSIQFGCSSDRSPFYVGMYGGSDAAGFLESDPDAEPFARKMGCRPVRSLRVFLRDLNRGPDLMNFRIAGNRRRFELRIREQSDHPSWWWTTRFGRLDSLHCELISKAETIPVARLNVIGLDLFAARWNCRCVGITDLFVVSEYRQQGLAQTLITEVCRQLRGERIDVAEIHVESSNEAGLRVIESCRFDEVDKGIIYEYSG